MNCLSKLGRKCDLSAFNAHFQVALNWVTFESCLDSAKYGTFDILHMHYVLGGAEADSCPDGKIRQLVSLRVAIFCRTERLKLA